MHHKNHNIPLGGSKIPLGYTYHMDILDQGSVQHHMLKQ